MLSKKCLINIVFKDFMRFPLDVCPSLNLFLAKSLFSMIFVTLVLQIDRLGAVDGLYIQPSFVSTFFNFACESITIVVYGGGHEKNRSQSESEIDIYILNALDWPFCSMLE